jgi:hypothetical protein
MRTTSILRSRLAALVLGISAALAVLGPGTAQAAEYYELAQQNGPCGGFQSLTVWKKGVQSGQVWSHADAHACIPNHVLYRIDASGAVTGTWVGAYDLYSRQVHQNISYKLGVGESLVAHSCTGPCTSIYWVSVKRTGPSTDDEDWAVDTGIARV